MVMASKMRTSSRMTRKPPAEPSSKPGSPAKAPASPSPTAPVPNHATTSRRRIVCGVGPMRLAATRGGGGDQSTCPPAARAPPRVHGQPAGPAHVAREVAARHEAPVAVAVPRRHQPRDHEADERLPACLTSSSRDPHASLAVHAGTDRLRHRAARAGATKKAFEPVMRECIVQLALLRKLPLPGGRRGAKAAPMPAAGLWCQVTRVTDAKYCEVRALRARASTTWSAGSRRPSGSRTWRCSTTTSMASGSPSRRRRRHSSRIASRSTVVARKRLSRRHGADGRAAAGVVRDRDRKCTTGEQCKSSSSDAQPRARGGGELGGGKAF